MHAGHGEASSRLGLVSFRMSTGPGCHGGRGGPAWLPGRKGDASGNTGHSSGVGPGVSHRVDFSAAAAVLGSQAVSTLARGGRMREGWGGDPACQVKPGRT